MTFGMAKTRWVTALFALLVAMFALAPIAEAAECGVEPPSAHQMITSDQDHEPDPQPVHGACSHGHCHSAGSAATPDPSLRAPCLTANAVLAPPMDDMRVAHAPDGLERPPRA